MTELVSETEPTVLPYADGPTFVSADEAGYDRAEFYRGEWFEVVGHPFVSSRRILGMWALHDTQAEQPVIAIIHHKFLGIGEHATTRGQVYREDIDPDAFVEWRAQSGMAEGPARTMGVREALDQYSLMTLIAPDQAEDSVTVIPNPTGA